MGCGVSRASNAKVGVQNGSEDVIEQLCETTQELAKTNYGEPQEELNKLDHLESSAGRLIKDAEKIPDEQMSKVCKKLSENLKVAIINKKKDTAVFKPELEKLNEESQKGGAEKMVDGVSGWVKGWFNPSKSSK